MKTFVAFSFLLAVAASEPMRQRYYVERAQEEPSAGYGPSGWRPDGPAFNLPQKQQVEPQSQYGAPAAVPQQQYGAPAAPPQQQYGAPAVAPQQQYGAPAARPQQQYGAPAVAPQQQYGAPVAKPQQQYGAPQRQNAVPQTQPDYPTPQAEYGTPDYATTELPGAEEEANTVRGLEENQYEPTNQPNELEDDIDARQPQETGEYYIALPDGRLQRVRYVSRQDVEAMKIFAKIRAENVEPLRGPIYAYMPLKELDFANSKIVQAEPVRVQYQVENPSNVVPVSSSLTTYTANYQAAPENQRYIVTIE